MMFRQGQVINLVLSVLVLILVAGCAGGAAPIVLPDPIGDAEAGAYLVSVAVGCGCHFDRDTSSLAGGRVFEGGFGKQPVPNLTSHSTGLGDWTDQEIIDAIRLGKGRDSENLFIMPSSDYNVMSDEDVLDLVAYLRSLDPVENEVPDRELGFDPPGYEAQATSAKAPLGAVARGEYLVTIARCTRCHTPNLEEGGKNMDMFLAGAPLREQVAPNLTPDRETGIGTWSQSEIASFLQTGQYSDGEMAEGAMESQINGGLHALTDRDAAAIAAFLKSIDAVKNLPELPES